MILAAYAERTAQTHVRAALGYMQTACEEGDRWWLEVAERELASSRRWSAMAEHYRRMRK